MQRIEATMAESQECLPTPSICSTATLQKNIADQQQEQQQSKETKNADDENDNTKDPLEDDNRIIEDDTTIHKKTMRRLYLWETGSTLVKQQLSERSTAARIPHLQPNDILLGEQIAQGCFGAIYSIRNIRHNIDDTNPQQLVLKRARHYPQDDNNDDDDDNTKLQKKQNMSFFDLATEAKFLQHLPVHSHIIRLRAILGHPGTFEYGIILDRLTLTLAELVDERWRTEYPSCIGGRRLGWWRNSTRTRAFYFQRVQTVTQLASALAHLHQHSIVYRDLKPPNIGFRGKNNETNMFDDLQLFDFGCAKELKVKNLIEQPDGYRATPMTGTIGYMAPEVMLGLPYGLSVDVYSFAMLMWYVFSLQKPIDHNQACTSTAVKDMLYRHKRPRALSVLSESLQRLMEQCWLRDRLQRPKMIEVSRILEAECELKPPAVDSGQ